MRNPPSSTLLVASAVLAAALPAVGFGSTAGADSPLGSARGAVGPAGFPAVYLVLSIDDDDEVEVLFHRRVRLAAPPPAVGEEELAVARRRAAAGEALLGLELRAPGGEAVFRDVLPVVEELRGEFHGRPLAGGGWTIDRVRMALDERLVVARLPAVAGGQLVVDGVRRLVFGLDELAAAEDALPLAARARRLEPRLLAPPPGDPANRVDFLVLGDGYTAAEEVDFTAHVDVLENGFFGITPYAEYKPYVNVLRLFTPSAESGADHPPYDPNCTDWDVCCADAEMIFDPLAGRMVDTAFEAQYCTAHIHRLLTVEYGLVMAAAATVPDWDHILVLVNDATYGGAGGAFAVASTNAASVELMQHEVGHSFSQLADEYDYGTPGTCDEAVGSCAANVTNETNPGLIKWSPWILPTTPIPTPENDPLYTDLVGLFEGALYNPVGIYRPRDWCLMQSLAYPFGEICAQTYVLRVYEGGWGVPADGVDPIEPGSEAPPPGELTADVSGVDFAVDLLEPAASPPAGAQGSDGARVPATSSSMSARWSVDGVEVPGATGDQFHFPAVAVGTFEVALEVEDPTPLVHPQMAGSALRSGRQWRVEVLGRSLWVELTGAGSGTVASAPPGVYCGRDCRQEYVQGTPVQLTATPYSHSRFEGWGGHADCLDGSVTVFGHRACEAEFSLLPTHLLSVSLAGASGGSVASSPAGIDCGADCASLYPEGARVTLSGTPAPGAELTGWSGDPDCADGVVEMLGARSCTAEFDPCASQTEATLASTNVPPGQVVTVSACNTVHLGPDLGVEATGLLEVHAGNAVTLEGDLEIQGELRIVLGQPLP